MTNLKWRINSCLRMSDKKALHTAKTMRNAGNVLILKFLAINKIVVN